MSVKWPRCLTPTHLSQIIRHQKNPLTALRIFHESKSKYPSYRHNGPVYATMINILATTGHITEMKKLIDQMKEDSCQCKDSIFSTAIRTYANAGMLNEAISLFDSLPKFNCVNWTDSFNTLFEIMLRQEKFEMAACLYLEKSNGWEVKNRIRALNVLIGALCKRKRSDVALSVFQELNDQCCFPDRETYKVLMRGLCEDGRLNEATHLLYNMFWRISKKGCGEDVAIYRILLEALCDHGMVTEAMEILGKILKKGLLKGPKKYYPDMGISPFDQDGSLEKIKDRIKECLISGGVPSVASYSAMAFDLYSEGKIDVADRVFDEILERGFRPLNSTYDAKMSALCKERKVDEAANLIDKKMLDGNCVPSVRTYNILLRGLCDEGKSLRALEYLKKMYKQVGCVPNKETYSILADGLCGEGHFSEACEIFEKMLNRKYWPCFGAYVRLIEGLCVLGKRYEAVVWLEQMVVSHGMIPEASVWNVLVSCLCFNKKEAGGGACLKAFHQLTRS